MRSRASIVALIAVAGVWLAAPARADEPASIAVTGEASITVPPDLAQIDGGVTTEAKTAREASDVNNTAMAKVLAALKASGLEPKDMQTSRLSLQPQYQQNQSSRNNGPAVIIGYRASNRVTVQVRDVSKVAGVIDTLVSAGANDIGGINFSVTTASKLLDNARTEALADARRKADIYAKAAGVSLGAPLSIAEGSAASPVMYRKMAAAAPASVPIAQGEETLHIAVNVAWAIKPAM